MTTYVIWKAEFLGENLLIKNNFTETLDFEIFDASGKLIIYGKLDPDDEKELTIPGYPAGMYFVRFRAKNNQIVKKVIKYQ